MLAEYFTSYESASAYLAFVLILLIPLVISIAYERWVKPTNPAPQRVLVVLDPLEFQPGQTVVVTQELNYSHGGGLMVHAGEKIELLRCHQTSCGQRWSGWLKHDKGQTFVWPIPPDMITPVHS